MWDAIWVPGGPFQDALTQAASSLVGMDQGDRSLHVHIRIKKQYLINLTNVLTHTEEILDIRI